MSDQVATVVIGRNEGDRLIRCLGSLIAQHVAPIVYVDSGSTDGSAEKAREMGVTVVSLDMSTLFTAARARNAGYVRVRELSDKAAFVQFVDGDCEILDGWIATALQAIQAEPDVAAICGRQRERYPDATIWNRLMDAEWDTPVGVVAACGGNAMIRCAAFDEVGGFRDDLIAGEEPEMCFRMREKGWRILRIRADMNLHDANMTRAGQWWQRCRRAGFAFAQGAALHGASPEGYKVNETRRAMLWGGALPSASVALAVFVSPWLLLLWPLIWGIQMLRLKSGGHSALRAVFLTLGKVPEAVGVIDFHLSHLQGRRHTLIEYK